MLQKNGFDIAELTQILYRSALIGNFHDTLLSAVGELVPAATLVLFGEDTSQMRGNFLLHRGLPPDAAIRYADRLSVGNPWMKKQWEQKVGEVYQDTDLLSRSELFEWSMAREWQEMLGGLQSASGIVINRRKTKQLVLELRFPERTENSVRRQATQILEALGPHLVQASNVLHLRHHRPAENQLVTGLVQLLSFPVLIIDESGKVRIMNDAAREQTDKMETFFVGADRELHAVNIESEIDFRDVVGRLRASSRPHSELFSVWNRNRTKRIYVSLKKLDLGSTTDVGSDSCYESSGALMALVMQDATDRLMLRSAELIETFNLTASEADLAGRILEGKSIGEVASVNGLSKQTLRNQLSSVMKKTATCRQTELVSLLTRLSLVSLN